MADTSKSWCVREDALIYWLRFARGHGFEFLNVEIERRLIPNWNRRPWSNCFMERQGLRKRGGGKLMTGRVEESTKPVGIQVRQTPRSIPASPDPVCNPRRCGLRLPSIGLSWFFVPISFFAFIGLLRIARESFPEFLWMNTAVYPSDIDKRIFEKLKCGRLAMVALYQCRPPNV